MSLKTQANYGFMIGTISDIRHLGKESCRLSPKQAMRRGGPALVAALVALTAAALDTGIAVAGSRWHHSTRHISCDSDPRTTSHRTRWWQRKYCSESVATPDGETTAANQTPVAAFTYRASGAEFSFEASGSYDNDGQISDYEWDFGDGNSSRGTQLTSHAYQSDGSYDVVLTVTDDGGLTSTASQTVSVESVAQASDAPPKALFSMSTSSGTAPLTVTLDASASSDDGQISRYEWNFGDGSATASGRTAMHVYDEVGSYTVSLKLTDDVGLSASTAKQVLVTAQPPATAIWQPAPGTSWQWQLTGRIDTSVDVDMYDIDLFDTSKSTIDTLHAQGRVVICYFSAGSWEDWRPDAGDFPASVKGNSNGWPGENWLDISNLSVLSPIMRARLDLAVEKGCDGVEPDNVDGYTNRTGFPLTASHQATYNRWLADQAHARGLSIGLKNDLEQAAQLEPYFDWALNEQCFEYNECNLLLPFVQAGKAVFGVEYTGSLASFCPQANSMDFDWLKKTEDLDASRQACR
jgi:hypothetical protein